MSNGVAYSGPAETLDDVLLRLNSYHKYIAVDTETISIENRTAIGVGCAVSPTEAWYFHVDSPYIGHILRKIADPSVHKVYFNAMFDLDVLDMMKVTSYPFMDVGVACQVQGLYNDLAMNCGLLWGANHEEIKDILPKGKNMLSVPWPDVARKNLNDCMDTFRLFDMVKLPEWNKGKVVVWHDDFGKEYSVNLKMQDCYDVDLRLMPVLRKMSARGMKLRHDKLEEWMHKCRDICFDIEQMFEDVGVNVNSHKQLGMYLVTNHDIFLPFTKNSGKISAKTGKVTPYSYAVDQEALEPYKKTNFMVAKALEHSEWNKIWTTYIKKNQLRDRAFTKFRIDLATGRLASSDDNWQNVPPAVRDIIEADNGIWTWFDYSQIEMRVFAHRSKDPTMLKVFSDPLGDIHGTTHMALWPGTSIKDKTIRTRSKVFNFSMIFDAEAVTMAKETGLPVEVVAPYRRKWLDTYSTSEQYMKEQGDFIEYYGYAETEYGRRMRAPELIRGIKHVRTCGINWPIQGTAADIIKRSMLLCDSWGVDFPLQVHDEVLCDGDYTFPMELPTGDMGYGFLDTVHHKLLTNVSPSIFTPIEVDRNTVWS